MTSVELPPIFSISHQNSQSFIKTWTENMAQSSNSKHPPLRQISSDSRKKSPLPNEKTNSSARDFRNLNSHELVPSTTQSKPMGLFKGSTNRPTLIHSYSTPAISTTSRLMTRRSTCVSSKTQGSGSKVTAESGSSQTESSISPMKSFNSLCSLRDKGLLRKPISGLNSPRQSNTSLSSPRHLLNTGNNKQTKKTPNTVYGARSKPSARSFNKAGIVNKKVISENKKNQLDTEHANDTDERIISWLIGVQDSEPEEPVAPFIEYSDKPLQTDIAVHIVFNED